MLQGKKPLPAYLSKKLWYKIDADLGEVTDLRIKGETLHFKSNGIDKIIVCKGADFKFIIQCAYYMTEINSPLKRYKHA